MIKFLHVSDFHFSAENLEVCKANGKAVYDAAVMNNIDFILSSGDWWDRPHYATEKDGILEAQKIVKSWQAVCPVAMIYGTPSHEAPGSLDIFQDVVILQPGETYGYNRKQDDYFGGLNKAIGGCKDLDNIDCILFGIPEVNKKNIHALSSLSAEEANAEAGKLYIDYVTKYVAPMRSKYSNLPAVCAVHGNFSDSGKMTSDVIMKASDIVIHTDELRIANMTYWSAGHIHKPKDFKNVNMSYPGSWGKTWGEVGFLPHFNMVSIEGNEIYDVEQLPYGTPQREKVSLPFTKWKDGVAYWVQTTDKEFILPENVHPWSKIEIKQAEKTSKRITDEQARNVKSLWDLFTLIDPAVDKNLKKKVDLISEKITSGITDKKDISVQSVKIKGCIFFEEQEVSFDISKLSDGLVSISGENGSGKSSLLSFLSPYPVVIGKDTRSGKQSAIKDFFRGKESSIRKSININNDIHEHIITVKAAHTQTPKVECYLNVNGSPALECGTFDEMFDMCEKLYGSYEDYLLTSFYVQPQQGKTKSSLMSANMTEIRNLVQNIAGVDREKEKRFALDKVNDLADEIHDTEITLTAKKENVGDVDSIEAEILNTENILKAREIDRKGLENIGKDLSDKNKILLDKQIENEKNTTLFNSVNDSIDDLTAKINTKENENIDYKKQSSSLLENKEKLEKHNKIKEKITLEENKINDIKIKNLETQARIDSLLSAYSSEKSEYDSTKRKLEHDILNEKNVVHSANELIKTISKPCEFCGKLSSSVEKEVLEYKDRINQAGTKTKEFEIKLSELKEIPKPDTSNLIIVELNELKLDSLKSDSAFLLSDTLLLSIIKMGEEAAIKIKHNNELIKQYKSEMSLLEDKLFTIQIDDDIDEKVIASNKELEEVRTKYTAATATITELQSSIKHLTEKKEAIQAAEKEVNALTSKLEKLNSESTDWKYISKMLGSDKIPALELDIIIGSIDEEATRILEFFLDGRYSVNTVTQIQNKKKLVDKFDIVIHDAETGKEKSFLAFSPGVKAFLSDAYVKSLVMKRNEKSAISYNPIILDEIDGPISAKRVPQFYHMQLKYYNEIPKTVLIVSHSKESVQFIDHSIDIESLKITEENSNV